MNSEDAIKFLNLYAQLKDQLILAGLINEHTQLILNDDSTFKLEYRPGEWYSGELNFTLIFYETESKKVLAGYQLTNYQILGRKIL